MYRIFICGILFCLGLIQAKAQVLTISTTVTDSDGQNWNNGTWSAQLFSPNAAAYYNGALVPTASFGGTLSSGGALADSTHFYNTNNITPTGAMYTVSVCSQTSAPCSTFNIPVTSSTQFGAAVNALIKAPRFSSGPSSYGYLDAEVTPVAGIGSTYFNVISGVGRTWNGTAWVSSGGGGGGASFPSAAGVVCNTSSTASVNCTSAQLTAQTTATVENVFPAGGGTINFYHGLDTQNVNSSCYAAPGGATPSWTLIPGDLNDIAVSAAAASDVTCVVSYGPTSPPAFSFTVPNTVLYVPVTAATQSVPLTLTQTALHGYTASTTYALSSLPSGFSGVFGTNPITGGSGASTLTMSFPYNQASGAYGFNVTGMGGGITNSRQPAFSINTTSNGLVEGWPMSEGTGATLHTITSSGDNLTSTNLTWGTKTGFTGQVPLFAAGYAAGANNTNTNFTGLTTGFSITSWINVTTASSTEESIACNLNPAPTFTGYCLAEINGGIQVQLISTLSGSTSLIEVVTATGLLGNGTTHFITMTYSGSALATGISVYIDGVAVALSISNNTFTTSMANSNPLVIGASTGGTNPFTGTIAYTRVYNRVLLSSEVSTLFTLGPQ